MTKSDAYRCVSALIDFCKENGLDDWEDDLYSLLDAISESQQNTDD